MIENITNTFEGCDRFLGKNALMLSIRMEGGERRVYECACGAVTVTITR
jgi:hypothetical protein